MKKTLLLLLVFSGMLLLGCTAPAGGTGGQTNQSPPPGPGGSAGVTVHIKNFAFDPPSVTVKQGTAVTWINDDPVGHAIKGDGFLSSTLSTGQSYSHTYSETPGDYPYSCAIHPTMQGKVTVTK